jgi:hypothetical protein
MDVTDKTLVMVMTQGIGANLTNDKKRAHLTDLKRGTFDRSGENRGTRIVDDS